MPKTIKFQSEMAPEKSHDTTCDVLLSLSTPKPNNAIISAIVAL